MSEIIGLRDLMIDYDESLALALKNNGFLDFRVNPKLKDEARFRPKLTGQHPGLSHFFELPAGCELKDISTEMEKRVIREPKDIREVIALGKVLDEQKFEFVIYAPEITGEARKFLLISRWPDWKGFGLTISGFDPDDDNLWDLKFIGFSDP